MYVKYHDRICRHGIVLYINSKIGGVYLINDKRVNIIIMIIQSLLQNE